MPDRTKFRRSLPRRGVVLTAVWLAVWIGAALAGVRLETQDLSYWQFIDPVLLEAAPIESLYYLHAQPPLFNAMLAVGLAVFGEAHTIAWHLALALMALGTTLATASVVAGVTGRRGSGLVAGLLVVLAPSTIAYAHTLFYMMPVACLITMSVWAVRRARQRPSWGRLSMVAVIVTALTLLWAVFHPLWLVLFVVWLVWSFEGDRWRAAWVMIAPLCLVFAFVIKNGMLFDVWQLSSWSGMNLARVTVRHLPKDDREAAIDAGELSPLARIPPFSPLRRYRMVADPKPTGVALLDAPRTTSGRRNLHHAKYVEVSRIYGRDASTVIRTRPAVYAEAVGKGFWMLYLHPSTDYMDVQSHHDRLGAYAKVYEALIYGTPPERAPRPDPLAEAPNWFLRSSVQSGILLKLWLVGALLGGPIWLIRLARAGRLRTPDGMTAFALVGLLWWVTLVCNLGESGENQRFRFAVEPVAIATIVIGITTIVARSRSRVRAMRSESSR